MKILFYGGRQSGMIALLTIMARGYKPDVIPEDSIVRMMAGADYWKKLNIYGRDVLDSESFMEAGEYDLLICCHGKKIIKEEILKKFRIGAINIHPCLYKYKGSHPIERLLKDGETVASVGIHWMTEKIDEGKVIREDFVNIEDCKTEIEVYNKLYLQYSISLHSALDEIEDNHEVICTLGDEKW